MEGWKGGLGHWMHRTSSYARPRGRPVPRRRWMRWDNVCAPAAARDPSKPITAISSAMSWRGVACGAPWSLANFQAVFGNLTVEVARPTLWRGRPRPRPSFSRAQAVETGNPRGNKPKTALTAARDRSPPGQKRPGKNGRVEGWKNGFRTRSGDAPEILCMLTWRKMGRHGRVRRSPATAGRRQRPSLP